LLVRGDQHAVAGGVLDHHVGEGAPGPVVPAPHDEAYATGGAHPRDAAGEAFPTSTAHCSILPVGGRVYGSGMQECGFTADVWRWDGEAAWFFATLPQDVTDQVREVSGPRRGF